MSILSKKSKIFPFVVWFSTLLFYFYQFIARSSFSTVLTDQFMQHFRIEAAGVGALVSCYYWVYTFMQVPAGIIIDKVGTKITALFAITICSLGVFAFASTSNYCVAGLGQMMIGFGSSFAFVLVMKAITNWFPESRISIMSSYTVSLGCLGPVIFSPVISRLVIDTSWIKIMEIFAALGIFLAFLVCFLMEDKNVSKNETRQESILSLLKTVAASRQVWILALYSVMIYSPVSALGDLWGVPFIKKVYSIDASEAAFANSALYAGMIIGAPLISYFAEFIGSYKRAMLTAITCNALSLGTVVIFCRCLPLNAAFFLFFLTGLFSGVTLMYPLAMAIFPHHMGATISGFINMATMVSGIILMPLIGWIIKLSWDGTIENGIHIYSVTDFQLGLSAVVCFLLIGMVSSIFIKDRPSQS